MDRMACVDIRALPLQLLVRRHPDWRRLPVVVVDRDKPNGTILWANESAHAQRIFPGMRYAAGLGLARELRGGVVMEAEIDDAVASVAQLLWDFSPRVEPSPRERGIFWLDASGLQHVFPSLDAWAEAIRDALRRAEFAAAVAVGFSRFGSYAAARTGTRTLLFSSPDDERAYLRKVPIDRLGFAPELRDTLFKLGVTTLGKFIELPAAGIRRRFGDDAAAWHAFARGDGWSAMTPARLYEPAELRESLDYPEDNAERLLAKIAGMVQPLLLELAARHEALKTVQFTFTLYDKSACTEEVSPASPATDMNQILPLLRLRLEAMTLPSPVERIHVRAVGEGITQSQLALFHQTAQQSGDAEAAFAKLRAQLGNEVVVRARLNAGHLPEAQYGWEPLHTLPVAKPKPVTMRGLVRRLYTPPVELPPRDRREPDGWLIAGIANGPVEEVIGPQIVSGGWWTGEISRAYYYVRTRSGRWLWIYHDDKRRRWFLQGEVQ